MLASFSGLQAEQDNPRAGVAVDSSDDVFGTTAANTGGTIFEVARGSNTVTNLSTIGGTGADEPEYPLSLDPSGNIVGTLVNSRNGGVVFKVSVASQMKFVIQPPGYTIAGNPLSEVEAVVEDDEGTPLNDYSSVTLTLNGGTFANGQNSVSVTPDNGYAAFSNLVINTPGTYTLTASDGTLPTVTSSSFTIQPSLPEITTNPVSQTVAAGTAVSFTSAATGSPTPTLQWQVRRPARQLIFIDETWAKTNMTRLRGRSRRGQRLIARVPHGHWKTTTLIAALGISRINCSTVVDGAVNSDTFESFIEQVLLPTLHPGDVVVMDNLSSHKRQRTRELIESGGAELVFLPPYSPDLNPIEMIFAKIKQALRSLGCRTRDALWSKMQSVLDQVSTSDAANCFRHCGYTLGLN